VGSKREARRRARAAPPTAEQPTPPLLVFVHIPKTAGTTLMRVLAMNEPRERILNTGNVFKGGGGIKRGVTFARLRGDLDGVRIVTGHVPLGIREHLRDREVSYLTVLREPADRTISHFFAVREVAERRLEAGGEKRLQRVRAPLPADPTLEDALECGYIHDNLQTRMLSDLAEPFGEVTEEMLEQAKRNLRGESLFFGLTERFDESLALAKQRLGLRNIAYESSKRVNATRPRGEAIPRELLRAAERCNRFDIELYRYAEELFEAELAAARTPAAQR
jgi:Sulfotransferase family